MTKIDIFSGFLGAGKTTLIKKLIEEAYKNEKVVLIENEFGEIGIDGGFLKDAGIEITEMNSGCICCSLVGDFGEALKKVLEKYSPDRILIEPSGVGKLSDIIRAVQNIDSDNVMLNGFTTIVDAKKCKMYMKNFGEFFNDQVEYAGCIVLSHTNNIDESKIETCVKLLKEHNSTATIVATPWENLNGDQLLNAMERKSTLDDALKKMENEECEHEHHHEHDEHCKCENHEHEHHHEHDEHYSCGHDHHHADDVFSSWGVETTHKFEKDYIYTVLEKLQNSDEYGIILRAKGILSTKGDKWVHFDYVPGDIDVRYGTADIIGRLCVIGSNLDKEKIADLFGVK